MSKKELKDALSDSQKEYLKRKYGIPAGNIIRTGEEQAVDLVSHRRIEVTWQCLHTLAAELIDELGIEIDNREFRGSVYGENGSGQKRP